MTRLGIELSPTSCRIVEVDGPVAHGREARVRSFAVLPQSGEEARAKLRSLRGRKAAVVVWNAPADHRQVVVSGGTYESMRAEALASMTSAKQAHSVVADIAPVIGRPQRGMRAPVVLAVASSDALTAALEPVRAAGIRIRSATTPAVALWVLARYRRGLSVPGAIEAYAAIEETATCIALVRDGVLLGARYLPWGHVDAHSGLARARDEVAAPLAASITEFVGAIGGGARDLGQVCVCGGLPELRSMTLPLMERLDVEVEPLDSLFGIDATKLPEPIEEFRERSVELRLAWAAAADWPPINLLRAQRRRSSRAALARAAVAAGVVAGLAGGWRLQQSDWWRSTAAKAKPRTTATNSPRATPAPAASATSGSTVSRGNPPVFVPPTDVGPKLPPPDVGPRLLSPPNATPPALAVESTPSPPQGAPKPAVSPPAVAQAQPQRPSPSSSRSEALTPAVRTEPPEPSRVPAPAARTEPTPATRTEPPLNTRAEPVPRARDEAGLLRGKAEQTERSARAEAAARQPTPAPQLDRSTLLSAPAPRRRPVARASSSRKDTPVPFDAVLGTILYSSDRKLAIVDGRIVGVGDQIRGARITEITPSSVLLRDREGQLRHLTLAAGLR